MSIKNVGQQTYKFHVGYHHNAEKSFHGSKNVKLKFKQIFHSIPPYPPTKHLFSVQIWKGEDRGRPVLDAYLVCQEFKGWYGWSKGTSYGRKKGIVWDARPNRNIMFVYIVVILLFYSLKFCQHKLNITKNFAVLKKKWDYPLVKIQTPAAITKNDNFYLKI